MSDLLTISSWIAGVLMALGTLLGILRIARGPGLADRIIALDLVGTITIGASAIFAISTGEPVYLLMCVVLGLLLFVGTVAAGYYLLTTKGDNMMHDPKLSSSPIQSALTPKARS